MPIEMLKQAENLLRSGNKGEAQKILIKIIQEEPANPNAWYGLSMCLDDADKKRDCLMRALRIKPDYKLAQAALNRLDERVGNDEKLSVTHPDEQHQEVEVPIDNPAHEEIKASVYKKKAGASTRKMASERTKIAWTVGIVGLIFVIAAGVILNIPESAKMLGGGGFLFLLILVMIAPRITDLFMGKKIKEANRATRGAVAEEKVGKLLEDIEDEYLVLHDVNCAYGNIDHLVVSPKGSLFMVETKSHHGKITVEDNEVLLNGHTPEKDFIAQSLRNSYWLRDEIGGVIGFNPWVTPLLVFTNAFVTSTRPVKGVHILNKKYLIQNIRALDAKNRANPAVWERRQEWIDQVQ